MNHEKLVRLTLWLSVPFNFVAAYALAVPSSALGQLIGLPAEVPVFYAAVLGFLVFGFGLVYAWLAASARIDRPVLTMGVVGKLGVFCISLVLWLLALAPGRGVIVASGDLILASIWAGWLWRTYAARGAQRGVH